MATPGLAPAPNIPSPGISAPASFPHAVPEDAVNWRTAYPPEAWKRIRIEGVYLTFVLLAAVIVSVLMLRLDGSVHPTAKKLLCCGLGGIIGSWIYAIRWYVKAVTSKLWAHDFIVWRLTAPFVGIFLSVSTYLMMDTGLMGVNLDQTKKTDPGYAYAVGFLVGLFSDDVMKKLAEVAKTVFGGDARSKSVPPGVKGQTPNASTSNHGQTQALNGGHPQKGQMANVQEEQNGGQESSSKPAGAQP